MLAAEGGEKGLRYLMNHRNDELVFGLFLSVVVAACASSAPRTSERPSEPAAEAAGEEIEPSEQDIDVTPALPAPPKPHASRAYDEWCETTQFDTIFVGRELPEPTSRERQEFDEKGRVIRAERDRNGDGEVNWIAVTTYSDDGTQYTRKVDRNGNGEFDTESTREIRDTPPPRGLYAPGRMHNLGDGEYVLDEQGQRVGYRKTGRRYIREDGSGKRIEVEEVGIFFLSDAGRSLVEFIVQAQTPAQRLPDFDRLRRAFRFDDEAGRWTWPESARFVVDQVVLFQYDDAGNKTAEVYWIAPSEAGVPEGDVVVSGLGGDRPHTLKDVGGVTAPIAPTSDEFREHIRSAMLWQYDESENYVWVRRYSGD